MILAEKGAFVYPIYTLHLTCFYESLMPHQSRYNQVTSSGTCYLCGALVGSNLGLALSITNH